MERSALNAPRWSARPKGQFYEAWYVVASSPREGFGLWVRYTVDVSPTGEIQPALWGSWFDRERPERSFAIKNAASAAAISRSEPAIGDARLGERECSGEVEANGRSLRWRLAFGDG